MAPASVFTLAMSIYTGFSIPNKDMHPWLKWFSYVNPVSYAFEALLINEVRATKSSSDGSNIA
jgi:ATP-binding cassette subfamily G (WHITE) protein 2 (PDR)